MTAFTRECRYLALSLSPLSYETGGNKSGVDEQMDQSLTIESPDDTTTMDSSGRIVVTDTDLNPILQMTTWLFLALSTLMLCFRLLTRFFLRSSNRLLGLEEVLALLAYVFSLGQSVTVVLPQGKVLGKDLADVSADELRIGLQAEYAGDLLFLVSLGLAKLSICACLLTLSPDLVHRRLILGLGLVIAVWTLASFLGSALRCCTHPPWNVVEAGDVEARCLNLYDFLTSVCIINILTDAALVAVPAVMVFPMRLPLKRRATVLLVFGSRTLAIIPTVFQLVYLPRLFESNFTLRAFPYYLSVQAVQFASISTTCVVYLWPLLDSLRSGLMWTDNMDATMPLSGAFPSWQHDMSALSRYRGKPQAAGAPF
ncbi:hypothetical protein B0T22DRAFT_443276 [Podospora appendiculata]|uniref:Rhodopsin domain-containing protein n=1 Tax=Podospora appendiculata TaxID=314037 RepID=A0AAE1CB23_9PEZI|nr:hypothetical protein B0T22DRAFT_443276 [Podospora appendiculata]